MAKANKRWSYSAGERGRNRVRAYEDGDRSAILFEFYETDPVTRRVRRTRISAGQIDRAAAKSKADEMAAAMSKPDRPLTREATLESLFDIYLREVTPTKGESKREHDVRTAAMVKRCFGADRKVSTLNRRDWDRFVQERRRGVLRHGGRHGAKRKNKALVGVRDRQIAYDLKFLLAVLNWAMLAGDGRGGALLDRNPLKGLPMPKEENPRRPLVSEEQYRKLLEAAPTIDSNLELALVPAHETGHRIGAIRRLRWSDVDLKAKRIRWRAENDKIGLEHTPPLSTAAVTALEKARRERAMIGDTWVFPDPDDASNEATRHVVQD